MTFYYPEVTDFVEMFGCESYIDDGVQISKFVDIKNREMVFSISNMQNSISIYMYQDGTLCFSIYEEGAVSIIVDENLIIIEYLNYQNLYAKKITIIETYPLFKIKHSTLINKNMDELRQ